MRRTYSGGCHCGAVRFAVEADLSRGTVKCNCTICARMRLWSVKVAPADFRLAAGAGMLTDYRFGSGVANHAFCRRCGIHAFERVDLPPPRAAYYNVAVNCLEGVDMDEVMAAPLTHADGLHDRWDRVPDEVRHL